MSTVRSHDEISMQYPSESHSPPPHLRNLSTVSNGTLQTTTSESYPSQPLLGNAAYSADSRTDRTTTRGELSPIQEARKRLSRLVALRFVLDAISAIWTTYTTIRYFIAYTAHTSTSGQAASLAQGLLTAVSACLTATATVLYLFRSSLALHGAPVKILLAADTILHWLASALLFVPALVNFILVFVWHNSPESDVSNATRCSVDVDLTWTLSSESCHGKTSWGAWLALAVVRLVLTSELIISLHMVLLRYDRIRYPVLRFSPSRSRLSDKSSAVLSKHSWTTTPTLASPRSRELRPSLYSSSTGETYGQSYHSRDPSLVYDGIPRQDIGDADLNSFADRFRSLVAQISHETEEAVDLARSDHSHRRQNSYDSDDEQEYYDYQRAYAPPPLEEHVQVLGSYVRRLSTIDSLGSREHSLYTNTDYVGSLQSAGSRSILSRPSTRATIGFTSDSNPPSRSNSLNAENVLAQQPTVSEHGETGSKPKNQTIGSSGSGSTMGGASYYTADGSLVTASPMSETFPTRF